MCAPRCLFARYPSLAYSLQLDFLAWWKDNARGEVKLREEQVTRTHDKSADHWLGACKASSSLSYLDGWRMQLAGLPWPALSYSALWSPNFNFFPCSAAPHTGGTLPLEPATASNAIYTDAWFKRAVRVWLWLWPLYFFYCVVSNVRLHLVRVYISYKQISKQWSAVSLGGCGWVTMGSVQNFGKILAKFREIRWFRPSPKFKKSGNNNLNIFKNIF